MIRGQRPLCDTHWKELRTQGWRSEDMRWPEYSRGTAYQHASLARLVGDRASLIVPLDTKLIQHSLKPDYVIENNQFILQHASPASDAPRENFYFDTNLLESVALQYSYTCSYPCRTFIFHMMQRWSWLECRALEREDMPPDWQGAVPSTASTISFPEGFELPRCWNYADRLLPVWYEEWNRKGDRRFR